MFSMPTSKPRLRWVDAIKAVALLWIILNHITERIFGFPYFANPTFDWPSFNARIAQFGIESDFGLLNLPLTIVRLLGWSGDQGVQLFIILSGFGLTWGLLLRSTDRQFPIKGFYTTRARRLYPLWIGAHFMFIVVWVITLWGLSLTDPRTYVSLLGIRITPNLFYYFSPSWWFIWLLIQLYLVFPIIWYALKRWGPLRLLIIGLVIGFISRALGIMFLEYYLDFWLRGSIFLTRLPEFILGVYIAAWLFKDRENAHRKLRSPRALTFALIAYFVGLGFSLTLFGNVFAPFLLGLGVFIWLFALFTNKHIVKSRIAGWSERLGRHSYAPYLTHHPWILVLIPAGLAASGFRIFAGIITALVLTIVSAGLLEKTIPIGAKVYLHSKSRYGNRGVLWRLALVTVFCLVLLLGFELVVREIMPQEVLGWGEKPSLERHETFGWRLIPSQETRLRWESYDYVVSSNQLGFPGPDPDLDTEEEHIRIFVIGDAFSSAEGVDTPDAWPRLLEASLNDQIEGSSIEIINFSVTGYGPDQYTAVLERYLPEYNPDLVIIGSFVNDFYDVQLTAEDIADTIGFDLPEQDGLYSYLSLQHFRKWLQVNVSDTLKSALKREPTPHGYFYGAFVFLEKDSENWMREGQAMFFERLQTIMRSAIDADADVLLLMIPAASQVCDENDLEYFPTTINLQDTDHYDLDLPQRLTAEIANELSIPYANLKDVFLSSAICPYQAKNMHFTQAGHRLVAEYLGDYLVASLDSTISIP